MSSVVAPISNVRVSNDQVYQYPRRLDSTHSLESVHLTADTISMSGAAALFLAFSHDKSGKKVRNKRKATIFTCWTQPSSALMTYYAYIHICVTYSIWKCTMWSGVGTQVQLVYLTFINVYSFHLYSIHRLELPCTSSNGSIRQTAWDCDPRIWPLNRTLCHVDSHCKRCHMHHDKQLLYSLCSYTQPMSIRCGLWSGMR